MPIRSSAESKSRRRDSADRGFQRLDGSCRAEAPAGDDPHVVVVRVTRPFAGKAGIEQPRLGGRPGRECDREPLAVLQVGAGQVANAGGSEGRKTKEAELQNRVGARVVNLAANGGFGSTDRVDVRPK